MNTYTKRSENIYWNVIERIFSIREFSSLFSSLVKLLRKLEFNYFIQLVVINIMDKLEYRKLLCLLDLHNYSESSFVVLHFQTETFEVFLIFIISICRNIRSGILTYPSSIEGYQVTWYQVKTWIYQTKSNQVIYDGLEFRVNYLINESSNQTWSFSKCKNY